MINLEAIVGADRESDRVCFDHRGAPLSGRLRANAGPATLLVEPVTDAIKSVDDRGLITRSLDKSDYWLIAGFVVNRDVLSALPQKDVSVGELWHLVVDQGLRWDLAEIDRDLNG